MPRAFARLRWQLTLSHLIAIAFTLVCMVAGVATIASAWWGSQNALARRPEAAAQVAAQVLTGVVEDVPADDLDAVLRVMASGRLRFINGDFGSPHLPGELDQARYLAVVRPDGAPLASSMPQGAAFAPPERAQWAALASQAVSGTRERPGSARAVVDQQALGAAPIFNALNQPVAVAIVALPLQPVDEGPAFWPLAFFGVATLTAAGTHNRSDGRFGDYFTARKNDVCTQNFVATNYALLNGNTLPSHVNARYVEFRSSHDPACP